MLFRSLLSRLLFEIEGVDVPTGTLDVALYRDDIGLRPVMPEAETDIHVVKAYLPYNDLWAVDFTKAEIDKGSAVRYLAELFKSSTRRFIAIGDSYNDIPMLSECGLAIAMGNAPNEVKDSSDLIAPNVEKHGLKTAIEEFIFPILVNNKQ